VEVFEDVVSLWQAHHDADAICIDMPIGLLEDGPDERVCEREARRWLGPRRSSVFPVPCRQAVYATSDDEARVANVRLTRKDLSLQTLAIRRKIREVDQLLRGDIRARAVFREVHPELLFWAMNGGNPLTHRKKHCVGRLERNSLLAEVAGEAVLSDVLAQGRAYLRRDLGEDDTLDALAAAVAATHYRELVSLPDNPPHDACDLPMQMVYWPRPAASDWQ
jgi:predicted RNase H-like nuclease